MHHARTYPKISRLLSLLWPWTCHAAAAFPARMPLSLTLSFDQFRESHFWPASSESGISLTHSANSHLNTRLQAEHSHTRAHARTREQAYCRQWVYFLSCTHECTRTSTSTCIRTCKHTKNTDPIREALTFLASKWFNVGNIPLKLASFWTSASVNSFRKYSNMSLNGVLTDAFWKSGCLQSSIWSLATMLAGSLDICDDQIELASSMPTREKKSRASKPFLVCALVFLDCLEIHESEGKLTNRRALMISTVLDLPRVCQHAPLNLHVMRT